MRTVIELVERRLPACGSTTVVALDGPSGAGKSSLADLLVRELGAVVLSVDDLVPGWRGLSRLPARLSAEVLAPLARDDVARPRRWDWEQDDWGDPLEVPPVPLLVLDGCGSGSRSTRPYLSALVWVDAPTATRRRRALERDGATFEPWWDVWAEQESRLFSAEGTRGAADLVVTTG